MRANWGPQPFNVFKNRRNEYRKRSIPIFDATEFMKMYKNEVWAKDVHLQRLSVRRLGSTEKLPDGSRVFKRPPEMDSVALP